MILPKKAAVFWLLCGLLVVSHAETVVELEKGTTLYSLSRRYGVPVDEILSYNQISDPRKVKAGTRIKIPGVYQLKKGDTLYKISRMFNVSVDELMRSNGISDPSALKVGMKVIIPASGSPAPAGPEKPAPPPAEPLIWPHPGRRDPLDDILRGVVITAKPGDSVIAVCAGEVIWADPFHKFGNTVFVKSWDNCIYGYAGNEELLVKVGDRVSRESKLAVLGKNSGDGSAKVYFFIYKEGKALSPEYRSQK